MTSQRLVGFLMRFTAVTHIPNNKYRLSSFQLWNITRLCIGCHESEHDVWRTKWCCRTLKNYDLNHAVHGLHMNTMSRFVVLKFRYTFLFSDY